MSGDWIKTTIGEQVTLQRGFDITKSEQRPGAVPVVSSSGISSYHDTANVKSPGVVLGRKGLVGSVYFLDVDYWPHDTTLWVKDFHGNNEKFVYYFFKNFASQLSGLDVGSANPTLNRNHVHPIQVFWPPISEQVSIAHILGTIDEKIELNKQINSTLEKIAQSLFKRWFIDFEFPDENGNPYRSSGGRMIDSESGKIPEGWKVKELNAFGRIVCGKTPSKKESQYYENGEIPFIKIPDMGDQIFPIKTEDKLSKNGAESISNKELPPFSVCVSCIATVGMTCITWERSYTNQQINSIIANEGINPYYIYFEMKEHKEKLQIWASGGSATLNLNTSEFSKIKIVSPSRKIIYRFHDTVDPFFKKILSNSLEIGSLSNLRDSLLPKLMSGKKRIEH